MNQPIKMPSDRFTTHELRLASEDSVTAYLRNIPDDLKSLASRSTENQCMTANRLKSIVGLMLLGASLLAASVSAHHSSNQFDMARRLQIKGTVVRFQWTNPHVKLFLEVQKDGKNELWAFEGNSPNVLNRAGWHSGLVQAGQKITVISAPARDGRNIGLLFAVTAADGHELSGFPVEGEGGPGGAGLGTAPPAPPPLTIYNK